MWKPSSLSQHLSSLILLAAFFCCTQSFAQSGSLPKSTYYDGLAAYHRGNFKLAEKAFRRASSGYITGTTQGRLLWVDAVCSYTMAGECYYQAGDLDNAMRNYRSALDVYLENGGWLERVTWPTTTAKSESAIQKANINWGTTTRKGVVSIVPKMQVLFGDRNAQARIQQGGVVRQPEHRLADVGEIMRCMSLALTRRREILGPLGRHAPFSRDLINKTANPSIPNHPYAVAWTNLIQGIALASNNEFQKAEPLIQSAAQAKGNDHLLTPIALFELANIQYQKGDMNAAIQVYLEATYSAAIYQQWDILAQSFERAVQAHLIAGNEKPFTPVPAILEGQLFRRLPDTTQCNLVLLAAELKIAGNLPEDASRFLNQAKRLIDREVSNSQLAARYYFLLAQINGLVGDVTAGLQNTRNAVQVHTSNSKRLFQIRMTLELDGRQDISTRTAELLYSELLNEPSNADWIDSPLNSITFLLAPLQQVRARWFAIALERKEHEKAIEIADNIRRFKFYNAMPLGGRLLAFRWMLEAEDSMVSGNVKQQKKIFELAVPKYHDLSLAGRDIEAKLQNINGLPEKGTDEYQQQIELVSQLRKNSLARELIIFNAALRRQAAPMSFPPRLKFGELQQRLGPKQAAWIFFEYGTQIHSFFLTKEAYTYEEYVLGRNVMKFLPQILKKMGNNGARFSTVTQKVLEENGWKKPAADLMKMLAPDEAKWENYDELIIVPDGRLWYLPFETLQLENDQSLGDVVGIRYVPTVSMIVPDGRNAPLAGNTMVVAGRLAKGQDPELAKQQIEQLQEVIPDATVLDRRIPFDSATFSSQIDTLIVWDEIEQSERGTGLDWAPLQVDKGQPLSNLGSWMSLPFSAPDRVVIAGYHTAAGSGRLQGDGTEIFLAVTGWMASGTRTILIPRWSVAGKNDYDLTRTFVAELSNGTATEALRRARELTKLNVIDADFEPRIRRIEGEEPLKTDHPFFWSGFMLIDTGATPAKN